MPSKSKITLWGHLGKDAELSDTPKGKQMVKFSIAQNANEEETVWYNVTVFGYGVYQAQHFKKSDAVEVNGDLGFYVKTIKDENGADLKQLYPNVTAFEAYKIDWFKKQTDDAPQTQPKTKNEEDDLPF